MLKPVAAAAAAAAADFAAAAAAAAQLSTTGTHGLPVGNSQGGQVSSLSTAGAGRTDIQSL